MYTARVGQFPPESLIRMTVNIFLGYVNCQSMRLPHISETTPFLSFWVHDQDFVPTVLPRIIMFGEEFGSSLHQPAPGLLADDGNGAVDWRQYSSVSPYEAFWPNVSAVVMIPPL